MIQFILGVLVGAFFGIVLMAMLFMARDVDKDFVSQDEINAATGSRIRLGDE